MTMLESSPANYRWGTHLPNSLPKGERDARSFREYFERKNPTDVDYWTFNLVEDNEGKIKEAHDLFVKLLGLPEPNFENTEEEKVYIELPYITQHNLIRQTVPVPVNGRISHAVIYYAHPISA